MHCIVWDSILVHMHQQLAQIINVPIHGVSYELVGN
jgi:hypothetical protein